MSSSKVMPSTSQEPAPAGRGLAKVVAATAAEILERYEPSEEAAALVRAESPPDRFLDQLLSKELFQDAISFLAYGLPRREAVWWALRCVRQVTPDEPPQEISAALGAVDAWLGEPGDEERRAAMTAAEAAGYDTPAGCLALSVFFSEGSMSPPDCPPVPVGEHFCAKTVAAAVHLSSLADGPAEEPARARGFALEGVEVANVPAPWEEEPA